MDLRVVPPEVLLAIAVGVGVVAVVQTLRLAFRSWRLRRRLVVASERGARGEARAEGLLVRRGFRIVGRQVCVRYELRVDGGQVSVGLRADYIVAEGPDRYVAEVKSGDLAPRIETAATRRQLLEYWVAFRQLDVKGVLLVDAEGDRVRRIEFPLADARALREGRGLVWVLAGLLAVAVVAMVAARSL